MFVSIELLLPSERINTATFKVFDRNKTCLFIITYSKRNIYIDNKYKLPLLFSGLGLYCGLNLCV